MVASRILIVEDERIVAMDLELRLRTLGYAVVGLVTTGLDALRLTGELHPDLVLMDIRLQGEMDGITAADRIRKDYLVPIVYLTAHSDEETLKRAQITEPYGYLLKPFQERELRTVIEMGLYKHQAERNLRASERRYATTLASIGDGVIATDRHETVTFLNPVAQRLTGWPASDAVGSPLADVFRICNESTREIVENPIDRVLREGVVVKLAKQTILIGRHGAEVPIDDCAAPIKDDHGTSVGAVLVFRDISEQRRQEAEQARLREKLQEASKINSIGRLAGGVAHDFNNLLTVINGHADLLLAGLTEKGRLWDSLVAIQDAGERAARLTQQLLAFSRRSMIEPKVLDLNAIVTETAKMLRRLLGENIAIALALDPVLDTVTADQGQLEQVLINLAVNARDAMPGGGRLTIETSPLKLRDEDLPNYPDLEAGRFIQLAVSDTGSGMTDEVRAQIFEPFFTTKEVGTGTGLGLAVVHGIVKQAGGYVSVNSEVGVGTTFKLLFPSTATAAAPPSGVTELPTRGTETVLLVEDEEQVRKVAQIAIELQGYCVLIAQDAADALRIAEQNSGPIHLLVTDVVMPDMGGSELADAVRILRPDIRVLFMSGYTDEAVFQHGNIPSTEAFIQKPFSPLGLARKIRTVLDGVV
jgi:two-component system, cell cycle sensor histidine kinase and response regulator CckA